MATKTKTDTRTETDLAAQTIGVDGGGPSPPAALLFLLPEDIVIPEASNVRPYSKKLGDTPEEIKAIQDLASTIEDGGQEQAIKVRRGSDNGDGTAAYELVSGRRRVRAVSLINVGLSAGESPVRVMCVLETASVSDSQARRSAMIENIHRVGLSPMDFCANIGEIRTEFKWKGSKGGAKVAEFLRVSAATIRQYEKLDGLSDAIKERVHIGEVSHDEALVLIKATTKEKDAARRGKTQQELLDKSQDRADARVGASADAEAEASVGGDGSTPSTTTKKKTGKKQSKRRIASDTEETVREETDIKIKRTRKEILESMEMFCGDAAGYPGSPGRDFFDKFQDFAEGKISERTFQKYIYVMLKDLPDGEEPKAKAKAKAKAAKTKSKK